MSSYVVSKRWWKTLSQNSLLVGDNARRSSAWFFILAYLACTYLIPETTMSAFLPGAIHVEEELTLLETLRKNTQKRSSEVLTLSMRKQLFELKVTSGLADRIDDTLPSLQDHGVIHGLAFQGSQNSETFGVSTLRSEPTGTFGQTEYPDHGEHEDDELLISIEPSPATCR